jgi:hypothetical protein
MSALRGEDWVVTHGYKHVALRGEDWVVTRSYKHVAPTG